MKRSRARLVVADDHAEARASLTTLLRGEADIEVVAEAVDGHEALVLFERFHPDLMLVDVNMPRLDGLALTRTIKSTSPNTRVVVVTMDAGAGSELHALKMGADALVSKGTPRACLLQTVRHVLAGDRLLPRRLAEHMVAMLDATPEAWTTWFGEPLAPFERELVRLAAEGRTIKEIRRTLGVGPRTFTRQVYDLLGKLGVPTH